MQNTSRDTKKIIRTAFIGVSPSEKVMLKGYFGFLFRSTIAFQWLAGNEGNVDFYLINDGFRGSPALKRVSEMNTVPHAVLYVSHDEDDGEGYIKDDAIKLPLHNLDELKQWMERKLSSLGSEGGANSSAAAETKLRAAGSVSSVSAGGLSEALARFMKTFHKRNDKIYDFYAGSKQVGHLHPGDRRIWLKEDLPFSTEWELKAADAPANTLAASDSVDAIQWVWEKVMGRPDCASSIIDTETPVALKNWFKPTSGQERRELIRIFTVLRKREYNVKELAEATSLELSRVHSFAAALLMCGSLYVAPDRMLSVDTHSEITAPLEPTEKSKEKPPVASRARGFLSRFRKKLGL